MTKEEYNDIPVYYCKDCLSLAVVELDGMYDYCSKCGSMHIDASTIDDWEKMYIGKYRRDPVTNKFKYIDKWLIRKKN